MTGYYDLILGLIPVTLAGITAALVLAGVGLTAAVPVASVAALGLTGHAMFVRAPVAADPSTAGTAGQSPQGSRMQDSPVSAD